MRMPWELAEGWQPGDPIIGMKARTRSRSQGWLRLHLGKPCPYCGITMHRDAGWNSPQAPSRDHKIPLSRGGPDTRENMIVCCRGCNEDKGSLTPEEYIAVRAGIASRLDKIIHARRSLEMNDKHFKRLIAS